MSSRPTSVMRPLSSKKSNAELTLDEREEEYRRLNAALEAQTLQLVQEADQVLKDQDHFFKTVSPTPNEDDKSVGSEQDRDAIGSLAHDTGLLSIAAGGFDDLDEKEYIGSLSSLLNSSKRSPEVTDVNSEQAKAPQNSRLKPTSAKLPVGKKKKVVGKPFRSLVSGGSRVDDLAARAAKSVTSAASVDHKDDDIMPESALEMGVEAQIRFLKAKVRVLQEELDVTSEGLRVEMEGHSKCKVLLKEAQEDADKLRKNANVQQTNIQKLKSQLGEEKKKSESKATQLQAVSKDLESYKRQQKQQTTSHSATEVRLNRAVEELDKVKSQLQKEKHGNKETTDKSLKEIEALRGENKRLERMRSESLLVMKKQQKLIGILKKQIVHIEAAKLLSFTEDEFVKALDWDKTK